MFRTKEGLCFEQDHGFSGVGGLWGNLLLVEPGPRESIYVEGLLGRVSCRHDQLVGRGLWQFLLGGDCPLGCGRHTSACIVENGSFAVEAIAGGYSSIFVLSVHAVHCLNE